MSKITALPGGAATVRPLVAAGPVSGKKET